MANRAFALLNEFLFVGVYDRVLARVHYEFWDPIRVTVELIDSFSAVEL